MPENSQAKPKSHFFTLPSQISQAAIPAFGPQSADVYNISNLFTTAAPVKAFAICKSVVLLQPNADTNKVNLILRPYTQPVQGVNIKYFIYRGLRKSDFITGATIIDKEGASDFIVKIRTDFEDFYKNDPTDPNPAFQAKYIGFDPEHQDASLLLDDFFFKESEYVESNGEFVEDDGFGAFELPLIGEGASLGFFSAGECAIDVVLDYGDYRPLGETSEFQFDLAYARASSAVINVAGLSPLAAKLTKEKIFQFLDIAAYYGSHTANGTVTIDNSGVKQELAGQDIYTVAMANFATKNKLYLYIQGDRTRSYNFYGSYTISATENSLKMGATTATLTERAYGTNGWPVIIESPVTPSVFIQPVTDNNVNTILYGQAATIVNAANNNFSNADDLLLPPDENGNQSSFTKPLELANPIVGATGPVIATYNIVLYQGIAYSYAAGETLDENDNPVTVYAQPNFFDDVFDLIKAEPLLKGKNVTDYTVINSKKLKLVNEYYSNKQQGIQAVQTLVVKDSIETGDEMAPLLKRVAYITETVNVLNNAVSLTGKTTSSTKSSPGAGGSVNPGKTYKLPEPYYYSLQQFTDGNETIKVLTLNLLDGSQPNKIILGITNLENELLKIPIIAFSLQNARLFLVDLFDDGNVLISTEGIKFQKYKVAIVGENSTGGIELHYPSSDVFVYSLDRRYHFSAEYSKYVKDLNISNDFIIPDKEAAQW